MECSKCGKCGKQMNWFSGNEGMPCGEYCEDCNDILYDVNGKEIGILGDISFGDGQVMMPQKQGEKK